MIRKPLPRVVSNRLDIGCMLNCVTLAAVFTLSFAAYLFPEVSTSFQAVPLALFAVLVFFQVFCSAQNLNVAMRSLLTADALVFVFLLSLLMAGSSFESKLDVSPGYWLLLSVVLVLSRLYMAVVPLEQVLESFFWSGVVSVAIFLPLGFVGLVDSIRKGERFSPFSFHPNLLAFVLAGFICVMAWKFKSGGWAMKLVCGIVTAVCAVIIFFASSRGSIAAIFVGILLAGGMNLIRARRAGGFPFARAGAVAVILAVSVLAFVRYSPWTKDIFDYTDEVLQLTQSHRGLDTGFSGRLERWNYAIGVFADGTWLTGHGLRFTDTLDPMIDNSYLVLLYEVGLVPAVLITWRFFCVQRDFITGYFRASDARQRNLHLIFSVLIIVFLVNNTVDRLLFGVGNPYSLLGFLLFATPRDRLRGVMAHSLHTC